jgi:catechol 2,3-dioxygenase-like lactoylglutathione lyase family enzyme
MMLRHVVMFRWREAARREEIEGFLSDLDLLLSQDQQVRGYRFGTNAGAADNHDFVLVADFDDMAGYLRYESTPEHKEFVARHIQAVVAGRTATQHAWDEPSSAGIHHIGATVSDLGRAVTFYQEVLGARVLHAIDPGDDPRVRRLVGVPDAMITGVMLETPAGARIELLHYASAQARRLDPHPCDNPTGHIAFSVRDVSAALERVGNAGGYVIGGPVALGVDQFAYAADPDGNIIEFIQESEISNGKPG